MRFTNDWRRTLEVYLPFWQIYPKGLAFIAAVMSASSLIYDVSWPIQP
jgi:hypothetical protein